MKNFKFCFIFLIFVFLNGCANEQEKSLPKQQQQQQDNIRTQTSEVSDIVRQIEAVSGAVGRSENGTIISVDLAKGRSSVSDEVLRKSLQLHGLKKLRVAGGTITSETLQLIGKQTTLEELYLQDTPIRDTDLAVILPELSHLRRLTLRGCNNVTDNSAAIVVSLSNLRSLAFIKMNLTRQGLEKIVESKKITALDLRQCSQLTPEDYSLLIKMSQLTDLKIAGFSVDDSVLETASRLPELTGLTVEDAMISAEGFAKMTASPTITKKLTLLVLARNTTLFDAGLESLKNIHRLKRLSINDMMITGEFLMLLAAEESQRPKLETLSLEKSLLTPEGAAALKHFKELKSLNLAGTVLSQELAEIIAALETPEIVNLSECQLDNKMAETIRGMKSVKTWILNGNPLLQE
jgi:Ran GTPase-activating protein (RanGAP) involved in mRNA processing and transport